MEKGSLVGHQKAMDDMQVKVDDFKVRFETMVGSIEVVSAVAEGKKSKTKQDRRNLITKVQKNMVKGTWPKENGKVLAANAVDSVSAAVSTMAAALDEPAVLSKDSCLAKHVQALLGAVDEKDRTTAIKEVTRTLTAEMAKTGGGNGSMFNIPFKADRPKWTDVAGDTFKDFEELGLPFLYY